MSRSREYTDVVTLGSKRLRVASADVGTWLARGWTVESRLKSGEELRDLRENQIKLVAHVRSFALDASRNHQDVFEVPRIIDEIESASTWHELEMVKAKWRI